MDGPLAGAELALAYLLGDESFAAYARRTAAGITRARVSEPILPALVAALWHSRDGAEPRALAVVCADDDDARSLAESAAAFLPPDTAAFLPSRGVGWGSGLDPAPHLVGERHRALHALARGGLVAVSADALIERVDPPDRRPAPVELRLGEELPFDDLVSSLAEAGYERADSVDERGQFSVRGGLVDVFPTTGREPVRVEFFGDQIERLSAFSAFTQRSLRDCDHVLIHPAAEYRADPEHSGWGQEDGDGPFVPPGLVPLGPELVAGAAVLAWNPADLVSEIEGAHAEAAELLRDPAARGRGYVQLDAVTDLVESVPALEEMPLGQPFQFEAQRPALASTGIAEAENELRALVRAGYRVLVCFAHLGEARRTHMALRRITADVPAPGGRGPDEAGVAFVVSPLRHGFVSPAQRVAVLPAAQLLRRRGARGPARFGRALSTVADLRTGDYVVHEDHGVGRFVRFDTKEVGGVVRDYLYLEFRGDDRLYVPHDQLAKVSRYVGADGRAPALARLGGKAWSTLKSRARVAVRELAGELLALYARRQTATRQPVGSDDEWMARLEASFPFDETDDQGVAIDAVKQDLEAPQPMDRLVCGDVGFGKTEVAVRAAFKVASAGRQVLMLVPTTILAQQHAATLRERFRDFPVRVEMVSRFRAPAEVKKVLAEFAAGKVDVLVGTHRVLSRDVVPQNLGLVVLDEEQRFGVAQKELLRQLRLEVDVLAMSATPIPRTLHMSLSGLRDISVITTPPRGRHPIKTHVGEFDEELIAAALRREHARGGQSFYLHNRVETIDDVAERVRRLGAGAARGRRSRPDGRACSRGCDDAVPARRVRRARLDDDHRVRPRHPAGEHARRRAGRHARAGPALPDPRSRRPLRGGGARLPLLPRPARALRGGPPPPLDAGRLHRARLRLPDRDARPRAARCRQPARRRAVRARRRGRLRALLRAPGRGRRRAAGRAAVAAKPVRVEAQVDAYVPASYVPLEAVKIDLHRRVALAVDRSELREIEAELADRFGPLPRAGREPARDPGAAARRRRDGHGRRDAARRHVQRRPGRPRVGRGARAARALPCRPLHRRHPRAQPAAGRPAAGDPAGGPPGAGIARCYNRYPPRDRGVVR